MTEGLELEGFGCRSIRRLDLQIPPGRRIGITGPSGSGKSLFLRAVADMDPHEGRMRLDGIDSARIPAPEWRRKVALLPSDAAWWYDTVGEHFNSETPYGLERLGFDGDVLSWQVAHLSSGERQRLALLRMLANQPLVLLLDEPTANLDDTNTRRAESLLDTYRETRQPAIVWVSHDLNQLQRWCDQIYTLKQDTLKPFEKQDIALLT